MRLFRNKQGGARIWTHYSDRRWWLHVGEHCLAFEVGHVQGSRWVEVRFGGGYVEGIGIAVGLGYGFWLTWKLPWSWTNRIPRWPQSDRDVGFSSFGGTAHLKFGQDGMGGRAGMPSWWRRWLSPGHRSIKVWDNDWVTGRDKYTKLNETEARRVLVVVGEWPGDEYPYDVSLESVSWTNRFRTKRRRYWEFKAVDGERYDQRAGKGENSWDLEDDGIYGCSFEDKPEYEALPALVAAMRDRILASRRRYGRPSKAPRD